MEAGTPGFALAPSGSRGVSDSPRAPLANASGWPAPLGRCRPWPKPRGRGEHSYAKVRALTRVATPETEARLLAVGRAGTAVHVERIVRGWRRVDRQAEAREAARQHSGRALHVYQDADGSVVLRGRLTPEVGALFLRALEAGRETLYQRHRATGAVASDLAAEVSRPGPSSKQTRWRYSRRPRCTMSSTPVPQASDTRS